jgi:Bacterial extracellular solute-binding proteins, family 5 Middle.
LLSVQNRLGLGVLLSLTLLFLLVLSGCGRAPSLTSPPPPLEVTRLVPRTVVVREVITRVVTPPPSAGPAEFVLCLRRKPAHLDPLWRAGESESLVWGLLGRTVAAARPDGTWMTDVFERVPTLKNGDARLVGEEGPDGHLEVTYHIRPDVRWEDGTRVTAADFRRAWEAARQGHGSPRVRQLAADVVDVRVPDARTLTVILRQGLMTPLYPGYALGPLPPTGLATSRSFPSFGPYRLAATFPNGDMLFVPNPTFGPPPICLKCVCGLSPIQTTRWSRFWEEGAIFWPLHCWM